MIKKKIQHQQKSSGARYWFDFNDIQNRVLVELSLLGVWKECTWALTVDVPGADKEGEGTNIRELFLSGGHLIVRHAFPVTHQRRGRCSTSIK
jgi:hypothetical protein